LALRQKKSYSASLFGIHPTFAMLPAVKKSELVAMAMQHSNLYIEFSGNLIQKHVF
jgi:hypothetical protein